MFLDHLVVTGETLEDAVEFVETSLGVKMRPGGQHAHFGTHNKLLGLGAGIYLEAIAIDPAAPRPEYPRWFDLDRCKGAAELSHWACRTDNITKALAVLPKGAGRAVALSRGDLRWRMAVPETGILPMAGCFPGIIQWDVPAIPGDVLPFAGCKLRVLEISHPEAEDLQAQLGLSDPRVQFVLGHDGLRAEFETPHGKRVLQ